MDHNCACAVCHLSTLWQRVSKATHAQAQIMLYYPNVAVFFCVFLWPPLSENQQGIERHLGVISYLVRGFQLCYIKKDNQ